MFKIESYVTPILLSYVDKYVRDFKPANAQVSLWGGGVALHNLVLKADVLQKEVNLPFTLVSGRIHELLIQVPWTKIMSEPIVVTIDTIECILSHPSGTPDENSPPDSPSRKSQVVEAPPGYMQALVRRIVSNISLKVHHLIVKYVHDDIVLSLNVKHLTVDSAGANWTPAFADIDQNEPVIRKLVQLDDLTLCLDRSDSDGKIRFYQEPLLYRCQLNFRVLTKLVSANTRRASSVAAELRSSKLAWGVTSDQVVLLLRLLRERNLLRTNPQNLVASKLATGSQSALNLSPSNSAEPIRTESWSEWAWSWVPNMDHEGGAEEEAPPTVPTPLHFSAYLDDISLVFKVMDDASSRKRVRGIIEAYMAHVTIKSDICAPTTLRVTVDVRTFVVKSNGKCVCGHLDANAVKDEPTIYLTKINSEEDETEDINWPENDFSYGTVEIAKVAEESISETLANNETAPESRDLVSNVVPADVKLPNDEEAESKKASPSIIRMEFTHERSPPVPYTNPYDNPPKEFEYSDWEEHCTLKIQIAPVEVRVCMGLIHRLAAVVSAVREGPPARHAELPIRTLTVEECEALLENLPQRRINIDVTDLRIRVHPWDHSLTDKPSKPVLVLEIELPTVHTTITAPLYSHRVSTAACQMPEDAGPIWQGARLNVSTAVHSIQASICNQSGSQKKPCIRTDIRFVLHLLLNKEFFTHRQSITFSYSYKIRELNISGSFARLQAAAQVISSLINQRYSQPLRFTSLPKDALSDEDLVALDMTVEDLSMRGYVTNNTNTHILTLQAARATVLHEQEREELKQAWLFSAPDVPSASPYLRLAIQWCAEAFPGSLDYFGVWTEPTAICVDPLFIAWLAYRPYYRPVSVLSLPNHIASKKDSAFLVVFKSCQRQCRIEPIADFLLSNSCTANIPRSMSSGGSSTTFPMRRRSTPPSSSGRRTSAEVHVRPRSAESSSEPSEKKESKSPTKPVARNKWWSRDNLLPLHDRLKHLLINSELGLVLVYVPLATASAVDCATVRLAMEQHAALGRVLVLSVGRWALHSSTMTKHLWQDIKHDGPTFVGGKPLQDDAFPWKMRLADVSCYIMEAMAPVGSKEKVAGGLRSQLKVTHAVCTRTILELLTTTLTLSVVTKSIHYKTLVRKPEHKKFKETTIDEAKMKYFTSGANFKPTTLKEFVRGPANRKQYVAQQTKKEPEPDPYPLHKVTTGPIVSLGFNLHADTPPIMVRLDQDQVHVVGAALHCLKHILTLLRRAPLVITRQSISQLNLGERKSITRSITAIDEIQSSAENENNDLVSIFESRHEITDVNVHTFVWFQWVIGRATLVVTTYQVKLAFEVDDVISTVDLQEHYNQLRVKIASATIKHFERVDNDEWVPGVFNGRVLEAREPANAQEDNHFLSVTITQAQISTLPASWKEELHPKMFDPKYNPDTIWEVYASLASLDIVLLPKIVKNIIYVAHAMAPKSYCSLNEEVEKKTIFQWPFCYINAGGLRVLVASSEENSIMDDTFVISINKITVNPYPENPLSRRPINACAENLLNVGGVFEGRQYELLIKHISVRTTQFIQLVNQEVKESGRKSVVGENPAHKWTQPVVAPTFNYILHPVDIGMIIAPALYIGTTLAAGPGMELNFTSDCLLEFGLRQIELIMITLNDIKYAYRDSSSEEFETRGMCPYASLFVPKNMPDEFDIWNPSKETLVEEPLPSGSNQGEEDSGLDTVTSYSTLTLRKSVSVTFVDPIADPWDYLEVFVTMGAIDLTLYAMECERDEVETVVASPTPSGTFRPAAQSPTSAPAAGVAPKESATSAESISDQRRPSGSKYIDIVHNRARLSEGKLPLIHAILYQPNIYYNKKKWQKSIQVSIFNMWVGLDVVQTGEIAVLFTTARGVVDPVTEIPPALATLKYTSSSGNNRGSLALDIERPIMFQVSCDIVIKLKGLHDLITSKLLHKDVYSERPTMKSPLTYRIRKLMIKHSVESVVVQACQIGVTGSGGTVGWDNASLQVAWSARPERLVARAFVSALMVAFGPPLDPRHPVLQPLQMGAEVDATWDAWRRIEGGLSDRDPVTRVALDLDRVVVDLRPEDLDVVKCIKESLKTISLSKERKFSDLDYDRPTGFTHRPSVTLKHDAGRFVPPLASDSTDSFSTLEGNESEDHYYKDDLRSGAFKIVSGGQLPMAYQVVLQKNIVAWRYPHPRAITRILAFPLVDQKNETDCVLEMHSRILMQWEPLLYFKIPVDTSREYLLDAIPPEAIFSTTWRFRLAKPVEKRTQYEFNMARFLPNSDPMSGLAEPAAADDRKCDVTAEQLSGVLRVDSYFSPRLLPLLRVSMRLVALDVNFYNSLPNLSSQAGALEGYYVSKPLIRCHRMLSIAARNVTAYSQLGSPAGKLMLVDSMVSSDVFDSATGIMEPFVDEFRLQAGLALRGPEVDLAKIRLRASSMHAALHVPRMRTLQALLADWQLAIKEKIKCSESDRSLDANPEKVSAAAALEGRVFLWIHNDGASPLRVAQEDTDEILQLAPGCRMAYRWWSPTAPKNLRFSLVNPSSSCQWSNSIPFTVGDFKVRLEEADTLSSGNPATSGVFAYVTVKQEGAKRLMRLSGRLVLANTLRLGIRYKVRARTPEEPSWHSIFSGELSPESVGNGVICHSNADMALKVRFLNHNTGWSGDIPLKECPKENVPWLVKVPSDGDMPYVSVWCRVVRARFDGCILATIWPLYILHSHIPLDTDVLLSTSAGQPASGVTTEDVRPAPLVQTAPGRGGSTHLLAPGTTSARHTLTFQYRNIECPVTRENIPLHYGVTDTSVFEKTPPVNQIDEVIDDILQWFERSGRNATSAWPYSQVAKHWPGSWQPALMQPRCDVTVRYRAVRAGGGCSLEIQLCPVLLLCNASPVPLTLRAHDAAPLCKLEPGTVISPPTAILNKPFFMSVELGRETFVSGQLEVASEEPGQYGQLPPGQVAVSHAADFAIQCNHKVALLTLFYEIKEDINILGLTSTFVLFNRLKTDLLVSAIAVSKDVEGEVIIRPKTFKVVQPNRDKNYQGLPLCRFWLHDRWRGGEASELMTFLCLALHKDSYASQNTVPIRLGMPPFRRAVALKDADDRSIPVVVTQHKHEGRWVVTVAKDPCPQLVVFNLTHISLCIGQPIVSDEHPSNPRKVLVFPECPGASWWCALEPRSSTHYSSPGHCARHPPPADRPPPPHSNTFTFARNISRLLPEWCAPVTVEDGEQLLQLGPHLTIKLRARIYPHSSYVELLDVEQNDIAASDIRKRLIGPFLSEDNVNREINVPEQNLERVAADDKLPVHDTFLESDFEHPTTRGEHPNKIDAFAHQDAETNTEGPSYSGTKIKLPNQQILPGEEVSVAEPSLPEVSDPVAAPLVPRASRSRAVQIKLPELEEKSGSDTENAQSQDESQNKEDQPTKALVMVEEPFPSGRMTSNLNTNVDMPEESVTERFSKASLLSADDMKTLKHLSELDSFPLIAHKTSSSDVASAARRSVQSDWDVIPEKVEERIRCVIEGVVVELGAAGDSKPLLAVHTDRAALLVLAGQKRVSTTISVADIQVDNLQHAGGQFDFAVVATTRNEPLAPDAWTPLWNVFAEREVFGTRRENSRLLLRLSHDKWTVLDCHYNEITELDARLGPMALYVEDAYVKALMELLKLALPRSKKLLTPLSEARSIQKPLRFQLLNIQPLDLTLTLHTAYRLYIALDHSPLHLNEFKLENVMTSKERLAHALTVHYLSAAILGAGWVVGGLELLGAPGALAARVGGATGGVRGIASTAAAALLRSLSTLAGSLARNLDLLAGDEEHARRAAAARRHPPDSFLAGLVAGVTNFAINILGAVGGLAHHPLVGVAVGETESSATALRRGLLGALAKPLSATADLVAYAGHGLLRQTGWDPVPPPRRAWERRECPAVGWQRDCVRWSFRLAELSAFAGFQVLVDGAPLLLLLTHKFLVIVNPETERIVEMIDFRFCTLQPFQGHVIELRVTQKRSAKITDTRFEDEDEFQVTAAAMARVARYTGAERSASVSEAGTRVLPLLPRPGLSHSLHAALAAATHSNSDAHFSFL